MTRLRNDGEIDGRTKEAREPRGVTLSRGEIEAAMESMLPSVERAAERLRVAWVAVEEFRAAHPELDALERERIDAIENNNEAILPIWTMLNHLGRLDEERWRVWVDRLNRKKEES